MKRLTRPSPALVVAMIALFVALSGSAYAVATINGANIINRTIAGKKLKLKAVRTSELANRSVSTAKFGKIPSVRVTSTTSQTIPNSGNHSLVFDTERWDTNAMHSNTTNNTRLVAKVPGIYKIDAVVIWSSGGTSGRFLGLLRNGSAFIAVGSTPDVSGFETDQSLSTTYALKAGDYVEIQAAQLSGGDLDIMRIPATTPEFGMTWLGPLPAGYTGTIAPRPTLSRLGAGR